MSVKIVDGNLGPAENMIFESEPLNIPVKNVQVLDSDVVAINRQSYRYF